MTFVCWSCDDTFKSKRDVIVHCKRHGHIRAWVCEHCDKPFGSEHAREQHTKDKHEFWCYPCLELHSTEDALELHNKTHHSFPCALGCHKTFTSMPARDQHYKDAHKYHCSDCDQRFKSKQAFDEHDSAYHDFKCDPCAKTFRSESAFEQHRNSPAHPHRCSKCDQSFPFDSNLQQHIAAVHSWKCDQCHLEFVGPNHLRLHKKTEHQAIRCLICSAKFDQTADLHSHKAEKHSFKCEYCTFLPFETNLLLKQHESIFHRFQCTACSRKFTLDSSRQRHFEEAHVHKCSDCGVVFNTLDLLNDHRLSHSSQMCPSCGEIFDNSAACNLHYSKFHRLSCPKCPMTFKNVEEVLQHAPEHAKVVTPVSSANLAEKAALDKQLKYDRNTCQRCGGMFLERVDLDDHLANDHGLQLKCLRPSCDHTSTSPDGFRTHYLSCGMVKCHICEGFFDKESDPALKIHMAEAHSPKPIFGCIQCTKRFSSSDSVAKHYSAEHAFVCEACPGTFFISSAVRDSHLATCSILSARSDSGSEGSFQTSRTEFSPIMKRKTTRAAGLSLHPAKSARPLIPIHDELGPDRRDAVYQLAQTILAEAKARATPAFNAKSATLRLSISTQNSRDT